IGEGKQAEAGLAVPASEIPGIVDYLKKNGNRLAGYLGVTLSDIEVAPAIEIHSPNTFAGGYQQRNRLIDRTIIVTEIASESPASFVKMAKGDLIISIEGEEVISAVDFLYQIRKIRPGSIVQLGLLRQNQLFMTDVIIGQRPNLNSDTEIATFASNVSSQSSDASITQELQALKKAMQRLEQRISDKK
ncbi:MAG TPA: PDZ domain-containing protein, partial [candidate division Zixibacteria bacterium]|nr:PDZ domain-containing protein [candidate division Zixibacteria bacterium]